MIDYDILNKTKNQEFTVILKGHGLKKEKKKKEGSSVSSEYQLMKVDRQKKITFF